MRSEGFTLVEILVALVVAALALSIAGAVFTTSTDAVRRMSFLGRERTREANGLQWLKEALTSADVTDGSGDVFEGFSDSLRFRTRHWVAGGWREPGTVQVRVYPENIVGRFYAGPEVVIADSLSRAAFDYLGRYGADSPWLREWTSRTRPPLAVRLRIVRRDQERDTIIFYLGDRG